MNALSQVFKFNVIIHQVDNPSMIQEFHPLGSVPTIHLSYHLGEHYNSVRLAEDPMNGPAISCPIGHLLVKREGFISEQVESKQKTYDYV